MAAHVTDDFVNEHTAALGSGCVGRSAVCRSRCPGSWHRCRGCATRWRTSSPTDSRVAVAYTLHAVVDDRPVAVRGMMRFEVRDGLIARRVDYWDSLVFQRQAGLA